MVFNWLLSSCENQGRFFFFSSQVSLLLALLQAQGMGWLLTLPSQAPSMSCLELTCG